MKTRPRPRRPPARPAVPRRRSDGERRRTELLDAAGRCFARSGVLGAGMEDIRREAGASPSSLYHQFGGLGEILLALLVRTFEGLFAHLGERVCRTRSAEGAVRALVDGHLEWAQTHRLEAGILYQAMALESGGLTNEARRTLQATKATLLQPIAQHIATFVAAGQLPAWSPVMFDVVLLGASHQALARWLGGEQAFAPEELRTILPTLAWKSVRR